MKNNIQTMIFIFSLLFLFGCDIFGNKEFRFKENLYETKYWDSVYDIENMTENELKEEVQRKGKIAVRDFYKPNDFGIKLKGNGGLGGNNETWFFNQFNSVFTREEAEDELRLWIKKRNLGYEVNKMEKMEYIGENDYYFQYHFEYSYLRAKNSSDYNRCIIYKESAKYVELPANSRNINRSEIRALDYNSVRDLLDLDLWYFSYWTSFYRIIWRDFSEEENEFVYTYYRTGVLGGDWGIDDVAILRKTIIKVNKITGEYIGNSITIKGPDYY